MVTVISVGGSIVTPSTPDVNFLASFSQCIASWVSVATTRKIILVVGGGATARTYQNAYKSFCETRNLEYKSDEADWIGISATYTNAQLVKACFPDFCKDPVVHDPTGTFSFTGQILVASGWKPGFSTDTDAVLLAEKFLARKIINLSNIEKVYTDDPKKNPDAKPIDNISWDDFLKLVGTEWVPGKNTPFDPVASVKAKELGLQVICAAGNNIENLENILCNKGFVGTTIQ